MVTERLDVSIVMLFCRRSSNANHDRKTGANISSAFLFPRGSIVPSIETNPQADYESESQPENVCRSRFGVLKVLWSFSCGITLERIQMTAEPTLAHPVQCLEWGHPLKKSLGAMQMETTVVHGCASHLSKKLAWKPLAAKMVWHGKMGIVVVFAAFFENLEDPRARCPSRDSSVFRLPAVL